MRLLKLALLSGIVFFGLFTVISLFIPSHIRISKAVNIAATPAAALTYIRDTGTWQHWHPVYQHLRSQGRLADLQLTHLSVSDSVYRFQAAIAGGRPVLNGFQAYRFPGRDSITVQWFMDFDLPWYPWQKFGSLFYENTYGQVMQQGLGQLRDRRLQR